MIVNMKRSATSEEIDHVIERIKECGFQAHVVRGEERIRQIGSVGCQLLLQHVEVQSEEIDVDGAHLRVRRVGYRITEPLHDSDTYGKWEF